MSSAHSAYDDADFDDSLFPAYANYIKGVETPWYEPHDLRPSYLPYPNAGPIPYTNSMPSRQVAGVPSDVDIRGGSSVIDLRSSSKHPQLGSLNQPEIIRFAPPPPMPRAPTPGSSKHQQVVSSAEITRQKLLQASLQRSGAATPPMLVSRNGSSEKRRMPARQATHPSLMRSSSATDIDSQSGIMPPSVRSLPSFAALPTPTRPQTHLSPQEQQQSSQMPSTPLIRPGEILSDPRYKDAPLSNLKRIDTQITGLYDIAHGHPDPESRRLALIEIAASSAKMHRMVYNREQQLGKIPSAHGYEQAMGSPQYEAQVLLQQHIQSMPRQAPVQRLPQQYAYPGAEHLLPNIPPTISSDLRGTIDAQLPEYIQACRLLAASHVDLEGAARRDAAQTWQNDFRAVLPPAGLQYLNEEVAKVMSRQNVANQQPQLAAVQAPQPHFAQQVYPHPNVPSHQDMPSHPNTPTQANSITEPLRGYIFATLPKYFGAVRACMPLPTAANTALQQQARSFMQRFKATVPPEGHEFMEEIVRRMIIESNEGRDPMALLRI